MIRAGRADAPIYGALLVILFWAPLPMGSNREWAWSLLAAVACLLGMYWLTLYIRGKATPGAAFNEAKWLLTGFVILLAWQVCQIIPLPLSLLKLISPASFEFYAGLEVSYAPVSLDAYATMQSLLKTICYFLLFTLTLLVLSDRQRIRVFCYTLIFAGLFQALFGSMMLLTGADYGFFQAKQFQTDVATGTFINRNHMAGFLELTLAIGIGILIGQLSRGSPDHWKLKTRSWLVTILSGKARLRLYLAMMVIALVLTHSRMGNTAFFSSLLIVGVLALLIAHRRKKLATRNRSGIIPLAILLASLVIIDVVIVGTWFGIEEVVERVGNTSLAAESRDEVVDDSLNILASHWLLGVGAGAYYVSLPAYQTQSLPGFYDHAHNDVLQFGIEFGLPGFLLLVSLVVLAVRNSLIVLIYRRSSFYRGIALGSLMGIVSLTIHSFVDFNLQIPSNAIYYVILVALSQIARYVDRSDSSDTQLETTNVGELDASAQ